MQRDRPPLEAGDGALSCQRMLAFLFGNEKVPVYAPCCHDKAPAVAEWHIAAAAAATDTE